MCIRFYELFQGLIEACNGVGRLCMGLIWLSWLHVSVEWIYELSNGFNLLIRRRCADGLGIPKPPSLD